MYSLSSEHLIHVILLKKNIYLYIIIIYVLYIYVIYKYI